MFEVLTCCTHGHNNPNSFRVESRGCEQPVSVPCGYAVYRDDGAPTWYYCHQCYGPERQSIVSPGSTAQGSGPTIPELFPTGSKAILKEGRKPAEDLKLRKPPLKAPQGPMDGHKGDLKGHGAEDA